ncbi:MAG: hypothetical protein R2909_13840 [Gemmatimonadales bacterium]
MSVRVKTGSVAAGMALALTLAVPAVGRAQGELPVPEDWTWRLDGAQTLVRGGEVPAGSWQFVEMAPGWHMTTTSQGAQLFPKERLVKGRWGVRVELFLFPNPSDGELGVVVDDPNASPEGSRQLRFVMRRDGMAALVARHEGRDTLLLPWTSDSAVAAHDGKSVTKYVLELTHDGGWFTFQVNGREMLALPGDPEHQARPGFRIGPGLNVHLSRYDLLTPLAPPRPRRGR